MLQHDKALIVALALGAVALVAPDAANAQGDGDPAEAANVAWRMGDTATARVLYAERLAADSLDEVALHRMALLMSWDGRYDDGVALFDRMLSEWPDHVGAMIDRARVLAWKGDYAGAVDGIQRADEVSPGDRRVQLARAYILALSGRLDESVALYDSLASSDPSDSQALIGLSRTLRWQGREIAAGRTLSRASTLAPYDPEVQAESQVLGAGLRPTLGPLVSYQTDTDGNRILTAEVRGGWRPSSAIGVQASAYVRGATQAGPGGFSESSGGLMIEASMRFDPGWVVTGGAGGSGSGATGRSAFGAATLRAASPARHRLSGSVGFLSHALDETARLIRNGVTFAMLDGNFRYTPAAGWRVGGGAGVSRFDGSEPNRRINGWLEATRELAAEWRVGVSARSFGFEKNLDDGYFDPSFYLLAQVPVTWGRPFGEWNVSVLAAPGIQGVEGQGGVRGALGASGRVAYSLGVGRELAAWAGYSSTGMASFSTGSADYRYGTFGIRGTWAF